MSLLQPFPWAYIDRFSGSILLQVIFAGVIGAVAYFSSLGGVWAARCSAASRRQATTNPRRRTFESRDEAGPSPIPRPVPSATRPHVSFSTRARSIAASMMKPIAHSTTWRPPACCNG